MGTADSIPAGLSPRQRKWFASVQASLERDTGKTIDEWVAIARTCPETRPRARTEWLRTHHGLGVNRAAHVLSVAFPSETGWDNPEALRSALWTDPGAAAILAAVERAVAALPDVVTGQRKAFTAFSRNFQFAAAKPAKGGQVVLGLAVPTSAGPRLAEPKAEGWSERLKSKITLTSPGDVDATLIALIRQAWEAS